MQHSDPLHAKEFVDAYLSRLDTSKPIAVEFRTPGTTETLRHLIPDNFKFHDQQLASSSQTAPEGGSFFKSSLKNNRADVVFLLVGISDNAGLWHAYLEALRILKKDGLLYLRFTDTAHLQRMVSNARTAAEKETKRRSSQSQQQINPIILETYLVAKSEDEVQLTAPLSAVAIAVKDRQCASRFTERISDWHASGDHILASGHNLASDPMEQDSRLGLLTSLATNIENFAEHLKDRNLRLTGFSNHASQLEIKVAELVQSRSWKYTAPYRAMGAAAYTAMRQAKALSSVFSKAFAHRLPAMPRADGGHGPRSGVLGPGNGKLNAKVPGEAKIVSERKRPGWVIKQIKFDDIEDRYYHYAKKKPVDTVVKLLAFYSPMFGQSHQPEDTETRFDSWQAVSKAKPKFEAHYQPRLPEHLGFYDLRLPDVLEKQVQLAKNYGVYGFSYLFFFRSDNPDLETPLLNMLRNRASNMPFCLTWAGDGMRADRNNVTSEATSPILDSREDAIKHIRQMMKYFGDPRYITIDGKPVLGMRHSGFAKNTKQVTELWRDEVRKHGYKDLYLIDVNPTAKASIRKNGFDAVVECPPFSTDISPTPKVWPSSAAGAEGSVIDYRDLVNEAVGQPMSAEKIFGGVVLNWDDTAVSQDCTSLCENFSLLLYKQWLSNRCHRSLIGQNPDHSERFVFINAWNEWAKGTYLEPDDRFGFGYLEATHQVITDFDQSDGDKLLFDRNQRTNDFAIVLHLHYTEIWPEILELFKDAGVDRYDVYVTATSLDAIRLVKQDLPHAQTMLVENRGRDVLPFLHVLDHIEPMNYTSVCKVHGKRSIYRSDGDKLRDGLYQALLGSKNTVDRIATAFSKNKSLGMVIPQGSCLKHTDTSIGCNKDNVDIISDKLGIPFFRDVFPAGSMFWFRPSALKPLLKVQPEMFELELGNSDGTTAHAIERLFSNVTKSAGFDVETTKSL